MKGENKMIKQKELNMIQRGFVPILENSSCDPRILETLSIIHNYDPELLVHCINTEKYVRKTLDYLGKTDEELCMAALIHDIGKIYVSYDILHKPGKLNGIEKTAIDMHSYYGYLYIKEKGFSKNMCGYVLYHHGEKREWITLVPVENPKLCFNTDILRACDIYDAMTSDRPYHKGTSKNVALDILKKEGVCDEVITCFRETL